MGQKETKKEKEKKKFGVVMTKERKEEKVVEVRLLLLTKTNH